MADYVEPGKPKPLFFVTVALVVLALVGYAVYRSDLLFPKNHPNQQVKIDPNKPVVEAPDANSGLTAKKYDYVPSEKLPAVKGVAAYKKMQNQTVVFALNVWAGWAPIIYAND